MLQEPSLTEVAAMDAPPIECFRNRTLLRLAVMDAPPIGCSENRTLVRPMEALLSGCPRACTSFYRQGRPNMWWHLHFLATRKSQKVLFVPQKQVFGGHSDNARFARLRAYRAPDKCSSLGPLKQQHQPTAASPRHKPQPPLARMVTRNSCFIFSAAGRQW